jgi:D-alanyl-D-alanine carboxypeptidase
VKTLDDHLEALLREGVPGAVVLAADGSSTWEKAAGVADLSTGARMTLDHRFRIASVTKLFTAAVVLQLVDEGALALDAEVGSIEGGVTVRQLLNHTSGLQNFAEIDALFAPYRKYRTHRSELTPRDALALIEETPRLFRPGEGWFYTGSNYVVLGLLVEEATGATLPDELRRRIVEPLGLEATDLPDSFPTPAGLARGYLPADNPVLPDPGPDPIDVTDVDIFSWGGGGMVSTARDTARFLRALLGGELLPSAMRTELLATVASDWQESAGYGLGIEEVTSLMGQAESPCGPAWGHLGFATGYTTIALGTKDGDRQVVILTNTLFMSEEPWKTLADLTWACFCGSAGQTSA